MTATSPRVSFGFYATTVKQDATPTCSDKQSFSKMNDLVIDNVAPRSYITYEQDFWLLNGGYRFMPTIDAAIHVGLMSESMSDASGNFSSPPVLVVNFTEDQSIDSLTLHFSQYSNDYADDIDVAYYDSSAVLISTTNYTPTSWEFSTEDAASNFRQIKITFNSTNKPYRYLRVMGIDYGELIVFEGTDVMKASLIEQVDPISAKLPNNTLELTIYSANSQFSMINPAGDYSALQYRQELAVYEKVGADTLYLGNYYLDDWESPSDKLILFKCVDLIGVLDTVPYYGGLWATGEITVSELLEDMFTAIDTPYDLDVELYDIPVVGWIPVTTYREALQQIAFMAGASVSCSRSGVVQIYKSILASDTWTGEYSITKAMKGMEQSLTLKVLVTGVEVTSHNYVENTTSTELYNGTLDAGTHTIVFNVPVHGLEITGASISTSGANYATIVVAESGVVVLSGLGYTDTSKVYGVYTTGLEANVKTNVLTVSNATLVNESNVLTIANKVYNYYQQRYLQKIKMYAPIIEPGKSATVSTLYNQEILGTIEKMTTSLTGGFVSNVEITGVVNV
jgi:hypothetical protein